MYLGFSVPLFLKLSFLLGIQVFNLEQIVVMVFPVLLGCLRPENLIVGCNFQVVQLRVLVSNYIEIACRGLRLVLFIFLKVSVEQYLHFRQVRDAFLEAGNGVQSWGS